MRKHSILLSVLLVLMATTLLVAGSAEAGTKVIHHFQAISIHCEVVEPPSEEWVDEKGILHVRDLVIFDMVESDSEYLAGTTIAEVDLDINLATGNGKTWVTPTHFPDAFDGTWVAPGQGTITPGAGVMNTHHGYGTGDFEGWTIIYTARKIEYPGTPPCTPLPGDPFTELTGIITKGD